MLTVDLSGLPTRPCLRVEATAGRRWAIRQGERTVIFAQIDRWWYGVEVLRAAGYRSPLPPIRASKARRLGADLDRWAHHFLRELRVSGPLYDGRWTFSLAPRHLLRDWPAIVHDEDAGEIDWFVHNGGGRITCLRHLSAPDNGRVKAMAKLLDEGVLPPILVWWVSGLDGYVLIDGHDRLAAALARGVTPPVLELTRSDAAEVASDLEAATIRHEEVMRHLEHAVGPGVERARAAEQRRFALQFGEAGRPSPTRAWLLPGGADRWREEARQVDPAWLASIEA